MSAQSAEGLCVPRSATVRRVIEAINENKAGIALVVDDDGLLAGTVTDGDVRRYILAQGDLDQPCAGLLWPNPVTASAAASHAELVALLRRHKIRNVPLLDSAGRPVGLFSYREALDGDGEGPVAVILAGGEGRRLRPLTESVPKPMLEVGGAPVLEKIVRGLVGCGFKRLFLSVNYKAEMIEAHFGDGRAFGADITYLREQTKLGTAGPLAMLPAPPIQPLLVLNGDVLTGADYARLYEYHLQHRVVMTVASTEFKMQVPYGVLQLAGHHLVGLDEKPVQSFQCNAGMYVINPELVHMAPRGQYMDMTDLLAKVMGQGLPVCAYPVHEYWVDIGQSADLERARRDFSGEATK